MPWKITNTMELRKEFITLANQPGANKRELMRRFNISPPTGYKWLSRHKAEGLSGLNDKSRRPHKKPNNLTDNKIVTEILELKKQYPYWGARKIGNLLRDKSLKPATSTVHGILSRHDLVEHRNGGVNTAKTRFNREEPNDLWQMDFKGHFGMKGGKRCHPLTICDDHSRYNILLKACEDEKGSTVKLHLQRCFERYGLPRQILCDNGSPWGCGYGNMTSFGIWLIQIGVDVIHGRPRHPQTQGKEERFHRTLNHELLSRTTLWESIEHCQREFDIMRDRYNNIRPHESIEDNQPAKVYRASNRPFPEKITPPVEYYLSNDILKKVKSKGEITLKNKSFYIGRAFVGKWIALRITGTGIWEVFFTWKSLGFIDLSKANKAKNNYEPLLTNDY